MRTAKTIIWNPKANQNIEEPYSYENMGEHPMTKFSADIFRDIQCDIVFFVLLRHIFGTRNNNSELDSEISESILSKDNICKELKLRCRLTNEQGDLVYLIMDGQYIKFMTTEDVYITKKPLSINCFNVYE